MIIACPACSTRYVVPDTAIGIEGRTVRCAKCRHSWFQDGPELDVPEPAPPPQMPESQAPAAPPVASDDQPAAERAAADDGVPDSEEFDDQAAAQAAADAPHEDPAQPDLPVDPPADDGFDAPPIAQPLEERAPQPVYDDADSISYAPAVEESSSFEYSPPFRPRLNRPRLLMIAAVLFAVVALGAVAYVWRFGLPGWMTTPAGTFAQAQPDLVLDFPPNRQDRRTLPNGTEFFGASGTVTNVGSVERSVPSILVVMHDARDRIVYSWEVVPPKRRLGPGESMTINEAVTDVPKSAVAAEIGWKPG